MCNLYMKTKDTYSCFGLVFGLPFVLLSLFRGNLLDACVRIIVLIFSITLHEFAHGYVAYRFGDHTAYNNGRLTLNPLAHFDPVGLLLILFAPVGWAKPVPFNPSCFRDRYRTKYAILAVSLAGVIVNFVLAFLGMFFLSLLSRFYQLYFLYPDATKVFFLFFQYMYIVNIGLLCFNILPLPPLDGFRIWGVFLPEKWRYFLESNSRNFMFILFIAVLLGGNLLNKLIGIIALPFIKVIGYVISLIF